MALTSETVTVWRAPEGEYHFEWQAEPSGLAVTIEPLTGAGISIADGSYKIDLDSKDASFARVSGLPTDSRHFFRISDQQGSQVMVTERRFGMQGSPNFRDFGGYRNVDGKQVKWGHFFRSGHLARLSERDLMFLNSLSLDFICDFRQESEQQSEPNRLPVNHSLVVHSLPIQPGNNARIFAQGSVAETSAQPMFDFMVAVNRELVESQASTYKRIFAEVMACEDARFLVHCAAGKDRTGFAAAIILLVLGVPEQTVMRDYLLSSRFYNPLLELDRIRLKYDLGSASDEAVLPMLQVNEAYLRAALSVIEANYGGIATYCREALGLDSSDIAELRRRYLE